ncbi:50S ribosomal protein L17 [Candidatus Marinamargulisbacteria bacterium SCGC AG-439-L15]|nr:50S ribosomal protein L17 [Candidatus Marinamargulisbacteria bacterium SCGC AG-439-L15]
MRHQKGNKKLGKPTDQRLAMLKSIVEALFLNNRIRTTDTRAKEAKKIAEKLITLGKKGDLHSRRQALKLIPRNEVIHTVFSHVAPKYKQRDGGFTRIIKVGPRRGDGALMSVLELVE